MVAEKNASKVGKAIKFYCFYDWTEKVGNTQSEQIVVMVSTLSLSHLWWAHWVYHTSAEHISKLLELNGSVLHRSQNKADHEHWYAWVNPRCEKLYKCYFCQQKTNRYMVITAKVGRILACCPTQPDSMLLILAISDIIKCQGTRLCSCPSCQNVIYYLTQSCCSNQITAETWLCWTFLWPSCVNKRIPPPPPPP